MFTDKQIQDLCNKLENKQQFYLPFDYIHVFNYSETFLDSDVHFDKNDIVRFDHLIRIGLIYPIGIKTKLGKWWKDFGNSENGHHRHIQR